MIPFSILDLAPVTEGSTAAQSYANSVDLAQHAERLGYTRYWLAEHHNMPGIASAATAVLIGHIAGAHGAAFLHGRRRNVVDHVPGDDAGTLRPERGHHDFAAALADKALSGLGQGGAVQLFHAGQLA